MHVERRARNTADGGIEHDPPEKHTPHLNSNCYHVTTKYMDVRDKEKEDLDEKNTAHYKRHSYHCWDLVGAPHGSPADIK